MLKLQYRNGLFVTNGYLSPQAKREFLDNYPTLELDYLEGSDITAAILSDPLLKALWFDGVAVTSVTKSLSVPILFRDLRTDEPFLLCKKDGFSEVKAFLEQRISKKVSIAEKPFDVQRFEPYRPPTRVTSTEGFHSYIHALEIRITGVFTYLLTFEVQTLLNSLAAIKKELNLLSDIDFFAVKSGCPWLVNDETDCSTHLQTDVESLTMVVDNTEVWSEAAWYQPASKDWVIPPRWQATIMDWIRLYNPTLDVCLDYQILSPPDRSFRSRHLFLCARFKALWDKSLFALFREDELSQNWIDFIDPSEILETPDGSKLLVKRWPALDESFVSIPLGFLGSDDDEEDSPWYPKSQRDMDEAWFERARVTIEKEGIKLVEPARARHLIAYITGEDPFPPSSEQVCYRTSDVLGLAWGGIASPVNPKKRYLTLQTVWELDQAALDFPVAELAPDEFGFEIRAWLESSDFNPLRTYLILHLGDINFSCDHIDTQIESLVERGLPVLTHFDELLANYGTRGTEKYWNRECGVYFS